MYLDIRKKSWICNKEKMSHFAEWPCFYIVFTKGIIWFDMFHTKEDKNNKKKRIIWLKMVKSSEIFLINWPIILHICNIVNQFHISSVTSEISLVQAAFIINVFIKLGIDEDMPYFKSFLRYATYLLQSRIMKFSNWLINATYLWLNHLQL